MACLLWAGCEERHSNRNKNIDMKAFSYWKTSLYALNSHRIREHIEELCRQDGDSLTADYRTKNYYRNGGNLLWIDRHGIDHRADTLLATLQTVGELGFNQRKFHLFQIHKDIQRLRNINFVDSDSIHSINATAARLEYYLTKAYLCFVSGERYGYMNPRVVFNRLDAKAKENDSQPTVYRQLFDVPIHRPSKHYYMYALHKIYVDSVAAYLKEVQSTHPLYLQLKNALRQHPTAAQRKRILVNMERCRWRGYLPTKHDRYVLVNIPAYHLYAYNHDELWETRVGCGALATKTPLLNSEIERMDVNPSWVIPMSIIKKDIARHAGSMHYFTSRHYDVVETTTGKKISPSAVTATMLRSGNYRVIQEGGEGNALGRIIFRFKNNFSVYLHDTSNPNFFTNDDRGVSHGCVRVQNPISFAFWLLGDDTDEWTQDKLRISMDVPPKTTKGQAYVLNPEVNRELVHSLPVKPRVPIYITYLTLYPTRSGKLIPFEDVYGYDEVIYRQLQQLY